VVTRVRVAYDSNRPELFAGFQRDGRVALSALAFARQRDRTYVLVTSFVLVLLLVGLWGV
jgi:hypothetical protein